MIVPQFLFLLMRALRARIVFIIHVYPKNVLAPRKATLIFFNVFKFCIELARLTPQVHLTIHVRKWHRALAQAPHSMNSCETTIIHLHFLGGRGISATWLPHLPGRSCTIVVSPLPQVLSERKHDRQT